MKTNHQPRPVPAAIPQLRAEIEALPQDSGGKRKGIPPELKRRIVSAWRASGMLAGEFAPTVSISEPALRSWGPKQSLPKAQKLRKTKTRVGLAGFKQMSVVADASPTGGQFTIEGPHGLKVVGLHATELAALWMALC